MANTITGKILAIGEIQTIPSKDGSKNYYKREIILDTTRYDPYTGERGYENTPSFEFFGDITNDLNIYKVGQIVTISFDIQGRRYTNKDGVTKIINSIRPYRIEAKQMQQMVQQNVQQPQMQNMQQSYCQPAPTQLQTPQPINSQQPAPDSNLPF